MAYMWHRRVVDLGPQLRKAFRDLVRRFPENDTLRPRDLYGHLAEDEDDSQIGPLINLYEEWMASEYPRDPAIAQRLLDTYRDAWAAGDGVERAFVLHFLLLNSKPLDPARGVEGTDLIIEGLKSEDPRLGHTASFAVWCLLCDGVRFGPDLRGILQAHRARFGEIFGTSWHALHELDEREKAGPDRS